MSLDAIVRFRLPKPDLARITDISERTGMSVSEIIRQAAIDFVQRAEDRGALIIPIRQGKASQPIASPVPVGVVLMGEGSSGKTALVAERPIRYPKTRMPK